MTARMRMFRRMLVGRAVATACSAALLTGTQVKPAITSLHTIFTNPLFWLLNFSNLVDVTAYFCHPAHPSLLKVVEVATEGRPYK